MKIETLIKNKQARRISIYFKDLKGGGAFESNPEELYAPASIYKIITMMAYFKKNETDSSWLHVEIENTVSEDHNNLKYFQTMQVIFPNLRYSVENLISAMIESSDNNALLLLNTYLGVSVLESTYSALSLPLSEIEDDTNVKTAASLFESLYAHSYLNEKSSAQAIILLSQTSFNGIKKFIPNAVIVASKYGEISTRSGTEVIKELHECGIVYYPDNPYILCIMTKGDDYENLLGVIQTVSAEIYNLVDLAH